MKKVFAAFDPGKNGGLVVLNDSGNIVFSATIPKIANKEVDLKVLNQLIFSVIDFSNEIHFIIEDVHSIFGMSAKSNFEFGRVCGMMEALIVANEIRYTKVQPKVWQKVSWEGVKPVEIPTNKKTKTGEVKFKIDTKATSLLAAKRLFPDYNFTPTSRSKKEHDGLIDAALIAYYGYVKFK